MNVNYQQIDRKNFSHTYLLQGVRKDGRNFCSVRPTIVNIKSLRHTDGSAIVSIGDTKVICGIKAELAKPKPEHPSRGFLVVNVEITPICSPHSQPGPPGDDAQTASTLLTQVFEKAVDRDALCIAATRLVWVLYVDIVFLNLDGGLLEASTFAATAALNNTLLPQVTVNPDTGSIAVDANHRQPLTLNYLPYATSFALFDRIVLQDPTAEEEAMAAETLAVVTTIDCNPSIIYNPGSRPLTESDIAECRIASRKHAQKLHKLLLVAQDNPNN